MVLQDPDRYEDDDYVFLSESDCDNEYPSRDRGSPFEGPKRNSLKPQSSPSNHSHSKGLETEQPSSPPSSSSTSSATTSSQRRSKIKNENENENENESSDNNESDFDIEEIEYGFDTDTLLIMPAMLRDYSHHATNYHPELWRPPIPGRYSPQSSAARYRQDDRALDRQELLKTSISPTTCGICFDSFTSIELDSLQQNGTKKIDEISKKAHFTLSFTTQSTRSLVPNTKPFAPSRREASEPSSSSSSSPSPSLSPSTDNPKQQMSTVVRSPTITPSISSKDIGIVMPCDHGLCLTCLQSFLTNATQSSQARFPTVCPQPHCRTPIPTESAELVLDPETLEIWYRKLAEVHVANKVCCPKPDCQSIIDLDDRDGTVVTCPECHSSFCASCAVPFHRGQTCEQYRAQAHGNETEEDRAMHQLVQDRHWRHCPSCRFVIEKQQGCNHMVCHCGQSFCYACGHPWNELEARCSQDCESYGVHEDIGVECTIM